MPVKFWRNQNLVISYWLIVISIKNYNSKSKIKKREAPTKILHFDIYPAWRDPAVAGHFELFFMTSQSAEKIQDEIFRKMSAEEKIKMTGKLLRFCRKLSLLNNRKITNGNRRSFGANSKNTE